MQTENDDSLSKTRQSLTFKTASEDWEFEQIHRLNYKSFVEEIPQHQASQSHRMVDRFHPENTYLICLAGKKLAGMLAVRGNRPFSLDQKLENLDSYLPVGRNICELRLLAIEKEFRGGQVLPGIIALLWQHASEKGYDLAIISGTTRQLKLYRHLKFVPFGPLVGTSGAQFQPMYATLESFENTTKELLFSSRSFQPGAVNFLPGPVSVTREVRRAFERVAESHRAEMFIRDFVAVQTLLCKLVRTRNVGLFLGSGTLANDVIGGQLALEPRRGIVLSNGEFGSRLIDHAQRWRLNFEAIEFPWGEPFDLRAVKAMLQETPAPGWLWCTHCETSTGVLNDVTALRALCADFQVKLCLDCISTVGTMPVDLSGVFFASCSSGKGLRSFPGISMVFHNHAVLPQPERLPRYVDLGYYSQQQGAPFTFSSNLLHALHAAVQHVDWDSRFVRITHLGALLRTGLREQGFTLVGSNAETSPAVVTIALPPEMDSFKVGGLVQESGYLLSYRSSYLRRQNWIQICLIGECTSEEVILLLKTMSRVCFRHTAPGESANA